MPPKASVRNRRSQPAAPELIPIYGTTLNQFQICFPINSQKIPFDKPLKSYSICLSMSITMLLNVV